jgi:hypothetical protein
LRVTRAPHRASADHEPIEQPLRRGINDEQELEHPALPISLAFALVAHGSNRRTTDNVAGPKGPATLFQRIKKFHKERMMSFARNIWPGVLALTTAAMEKLRNPPSGNWRKSTPFLRSSSNYLCRGGANFRGTGFWRVPDELNDGISAETA